MRFSTILATLLLICLGCDQAPPPKSTAAAAPHYPPHWWESVSKEGAPDWEILPQEAGPGEVILSKRNELGLFRTSPPHRSNSMASDTPASKVFGK